MVGHGPRDDRLDDLALGVGVVLDIDPVTCRQLALGGLVEPAIGFVGPEAVAKGERPVDLGRAFREDVQVDGRVRPLNSRCSNQSGSRARMT